MSRRDSWKRMLLAGAAANAIVVLSKYAVATMPLVGWIWLVLLLSSIVLASFVVSWWREGSSPP